MTRFDMHIHTAETNDPIATIHAGDIVRLYHEKGYNGIVITDHFSLPLRNWLRHELRGMTHAQMIDRWMQGYRNAKEVGDRVGVAVFLGMELRFHDSPNDYLIYGLDEYFLKNNPPLDYLNLDELNRIKTDDMLIYQAHPFRPEMVFRYPEKTFGVEVYNGALSAERNHMADILADTFHLHKISGSDFHHIRQLANGGLDFYDDIRTQCDFLDALRNDRYQLITEKVI